MNVGSRQALKVCEKEWPPHGFLQITRPGDVGRDWEVRVGGERPTEMVQTHSTEAATGTLQTDRVPGTVSGVLHPHYSAGRSALFTPPFYIYIYIYFFFFLAALGLSGSTQDLRSSSQHAGSSVCQANS